MRIRIKICGITRPADAQAAARLGADAVGLVFAAGSPRRLSIEQALAVAQSLPPFVCKVGVFQDTPAAEIQAVLHRLPLDLLQFHGVEPPDECARWNRPWLRAVPMQGDSDPEEYMARYRGAGGFLLDAHAPGGAGGKGRRFDWSRVPTDAPAPLILAGGLTPDNVFGAITNIPTYGVDVSSGVESAPGIKDAGLIATFIAEVRRAERGTNRA